MMADHTAQAKRTKSRGFRPFLDLRKSSFNVWLFSAYNAFEDQINVRYAMKCEKNVPLAQELIRARAAELNSISEYCYQSIVFADHLPEASRLFDSIAQDEMRHHRILGELILKLGCDCAERSAVRNSGRICIKEESYCCALSALKQALCSNVRDEMRAHASYRRLAQMAQNCGQITVSDILFEIANDESRHAKQQENMQN
jgi:rubrerythrin